MPREHYRAVDYGRFPILGGVPRSGRTTHKRPRVEPLTRLDADVRAVPSDAPPATQAKGRKLYVKALADWAAALPPAPEIPPPAVEPKLRPATREWQPREGTCLVAVEPRMWVYHRP